MADSFNALPRPEGHLPLNDIQRVDLGKKTLGQILSDDPKNVAHFNMDRPIQVAQEIDRRSGIGSDAARLIALKHFNGRILE